MFARVTRLQCPVDRLDQFVAVFEQELAPSGLAMDGNLGAALLVDRSDGSGQVITYWDSAKSMLASEEALPPLRDRSIQSGAQILDVDRLEVVIQERTTSPRANTFVRVNDFQRAATEVDEALTFARERVLPVLREQPGFRANVVAVNRETGRIMASSIWDTAAERDASEPVMRALREEAGRLTATQATVRLYEVAFVEIKQAAAV